MKEATLPQGIQLLRLIEKMPSEYVQGHFASGLITALLSKDPKDVDVDRVKEALGLGLLFRIYLNRKISRRHLIDIGEYDRVNDEILKHDCLIPRESKDLVALLTFGGHRRNEGTFMFAGKVEASEVIDWMRVQGLRPANQMELLTFGVRVRDFLQRFYQKSKAISLRTITALGEPLRSGECVKYPAIVFSGDEIRLDYVAGFGRFDTSKDIHLAFREE